MMYNNICLVKFLKLFERKGFYLPIYYSWQVIIKRFKTPKELVSYVGLCPRIYQSGNMERTERNQAVNKWLKWILYECSGRVGMLDPRF